MHDRLFENQQHMSAADLRRHAQMLGLDMRRFDAELTDHVYLQRVQEHIASGRASHLRATPGFFVDGMVVDTSFSMQALADAIEHRLPPP